MAKASQKISLVASDIYGIVKWFNKGTGRIKIQEYGEVFVHFSQIKKPSPKCYVPRKFLIKGQTVKCDLLSGPKGLQARKVVVIIDTSDDDKRSVTSDITDSASVCDDYYDEESSCESDYDEPTERIKILDRDLRGEVLSYFIARGFGFIKTLKYGNIFCHNSDINFTGKTEVKKLEPTQIVKCDVGRGPKGLIALNVRVICEASPAVPNQRRRDSSINRQQKTNDPMKVDNEAKIQKPKPNKQTAMKSKKKDPVKGVAQPKPVEINAPAESLQKGDRSSDSVIHADVFGEVIHYNPIKGFGFIKVPIHGSVYVHKSGLKDCETLEKQQVVRFDMIQGPKSLMAINLKVVSEAAIETSKPTLYDELKELDKVFQELIEKDQELRNKTSKPEVQKAESKAKKKKTKTSNLPKATAQPASAPRHSYTAPPLMPPAASVMHPIYPPPPAAEFPYSSSMGLEMHMPGPPQPFGPCGPPPPYRMPQPIFAPRPPSRNMNPPPYPGQSSVQTMLNNTHISTTKDTFAKPQDPKPSDDKHHEAIVKELTCGICEDLLEDPVITPCEHLFCRGCLLEWLPYNAQCPIDREPLSKDVMKDAPKVIKNLLSKA